MQNIFVLMSKLKNTTFCFGLLTAILSFNIYFSQSRSEKIKNYIEKHKHLAIEQMVRFNIPASVILAQAIKESDFGTSHLAKNTNNHFGIKCHSEWGGDVWLLDDDSEDECFRAYASVEDSYTDHSMFLISRPRYSHLFTNKPTDYYSWCIGLKKAGYATAWNYSDELLLIIAVFDLDRFDKIEQMPSLFCYNQFVNFEEKSIIPSSQNYFSTAEKAILAQVILNLEPVVEQPLLVRRNIPEHAE